MQKNKVANTFGFQFRSLKKVDTNALIADLNRIPGSIPNTYSNKSDKMLNTWIKLVLDVVDTHAPMKKKRVKSPDKPSLLTNEIQEAIKHHKHLKKTTRSWKNSNFTEKMNLLGWPNTKCVANTTFCTILLKFAQGQRLILHQICYPQQ